MTMYNSDALNWGDKISAEEIPTSDYVVLKPGEYEFTIDSFERSQYNGGEKMGPCPMVLVNLHVKTPEGNAFVNNHRLYLSRKTLGLLAAFFECIGMKKKGEDIDLRWFDSIVGKKGTAKFSNREYNGNVYNQVDRFLVPKANKFDGVL